MKMVLSENLLWTKKTITSPSDVTDRSDRKGLKGLKWLKGLRWGYDGLRTVEDLQETLKIFKNC